MHNFTEHLGRTVVAIMMAAFSLAWFFYYSLSASSPISNVVLNRFYNVPSESTISNVASLQQPSIVLKDVDKYGHVVTSPSTQGVKKTNIHIYKEDYYHNFKNDVWVTVPGQGIVSGANLPNLNYKMLSLNSSKRAAYSNAEQYYQIRYYYRAPNDTITIFTTTVVIHN